MSDSASIKQPAPASRGYKSTRVASDGQPDVRRSATRWPRGGAEYRVPPRLPAAKGGHDVAVSPDADSKLTADVVLLASALAGRRDELAETMTQTSINPVRAYQPVPTREEVLRDYGAHLDAVIHASALPAGQQARVVRAVAAAHGRAGAGKGVPLAVLMEFYRVGLRVLSEAVLQACDGDGMRGGALVDAISAVWRLQDVWIQSVTDSYYKESREAILCRERERSALVEAVLDGRAHDAGESWDVAEALRLPHDTHYVVVAAEVPDASSQEKIRMVENRLSRVGISSAWRLLPDGQAMVAGIAAVGARAGLQLLVEVLDATWEHRAGISPQFATLDSARRALRFAKLAMAGGQRGSGAVTVFDQAPLAVVVASAPDVLAEVAQAVLGSLNRLPDDERQVLVSTLRAWLACGGSTEATAKALFCHPNTVRYRLNRVTEHTGRSLTDPQAVTELSLALQADLLAQPQVPDQARNPRKQPGGSREMARPGK